MSSLDLKSDPGTFQPQWTLTASETGEAVRIASWPDKSYGVWGTFGGTVRIEGSFDKSTAPSEDSWFTLTESDNTTAISGSARMSGVILENPIWIRPKALASVVSVFVGLNCTKGGK